MAMNVQFLKGQSSKFKAEGFSPVSTTFYFLEDTLELYLGSKLLSNEVTAAQFAALEARVKALEDADFQSQIDAIEETLKSIATSETVTAIDNRLKAVEEDYLKKADKEALQAEIDADVKVVTDLLASDYSTKAVADTLYAGKAYENKVDTLVGEDADASVRTIAASEVAKVVASAPEDFDTLKEIADWIASDSTGAAAMSNAIEALKKEIGGEQTADGFTNSRIDALEAKVDVEKVSEAITAATTDMATNASVDTKLEPYAKSADVTTEIGNAVADKATKTELSDGLAAKTDKATYEAYVEATNGRLDAVEAKPAMDITAEQIAAWDGEVGAKALAESKATLDDVKTTYIGETNAKLVDVVAAVNKLADGAETADGAIRNAESNINDIVAQLTWGSF